MSVEETLRLLGESTPLLTSTSVSAPKGTLRAETKFEGSLTLPFAPLDEVLANVPSEPEWLWQGYLAPGSLTLLAGRPKVGKSTLLFGLLEALRTGAAFAGRSTMQASAVLLSEERHGTLKQKAERFSLGAVDLLMAHDATDRPWEEVVAQAAIRCLETSATLLLVDTLPAWARIPADGENAAGAVLAAVAPLQEAASSGLAVWAAAHQRKSGGEYGEAVRGSNALTGAADIVLELERHGDGAIRVLRAVSRYESTPAELVLELTERGYEPRDSLASVREVDERRRLIETLETAASWLTAADLSDATDIPESTVRKRLNALPEGTVERRGAGRRNDPYSFRTAQSVSAETEAAAQLPLLPDGAT